MMIRNRAISVSLFSIILLACLVWRAEAAFILEHPLDQKGTEGSSVEFAVTAAGENVEYQWTKDNEDIAGATTSSYRIDNITLEESGSWFRCRVFLDGVSETSLEAQLIVYGRGDYDWDNDIDNDDLLQLTRNIGDHLGTTEGDPDAFSVDPWEFDWNNDDKVNDEDLEILSQQCTTPDCEVIEADVPVITVQPESYQLKEGDSVQLEVDAVGTELTYQWQKNGEDIEGANKRSLSLSDIPYAEDGSSYKCEVSNAAASTLSRNSIISISRRADVDGDGDVDSDDLLQVETFLGMNSSECPECNQDGDGKITTEDVEMVTESCDVQNCADKSLPQPLIVSQPRNQQIIFGDTATFAVAAVGSELSFQWFRDDQPIADATTHRLTLDQISLEDSGARFFCRIMSGDTAVDSEVAQLNIYRGGDFDWDGDIDEDDVRVVRVSLYEKAKEVPDANFDTNKEINLGDLRHLMRLCTCPVCQEPQPPVIIGEPEDTLVIEKTSATFTVQASGIRLHYQWLVDGEVIPGADKATYVLDSASLYDHGKHYSCMVTNAGGSVTSREALLEVDMDVPENTLVVGGLNAIWQKDKALVTWQVAESMRYQVQRGSAADATAVIGETEQASYVDSDAPYYYGWYYRVATIKDYFHPVSGKAYHSIGPLSDPFLLEAQPASTIQLDNIPIRDDGSYLAYFLSGSTISGSYANMDDPVKITAVGNGTVAVDGNNGHFSLSLPGPGIWQIEAMEPEGYRSAKLYLELVTDTTPPELILHSPEEMNTNASTVTITGEVHDSGSGVQSVMVASDRYPLNVSGLYNENGFFQIDVPVETGANNLTIIALDNSGNQASATVKVEVTIPALPQLSITSPADGTVVETDTIGVMGIVRSSLPPEQIRLNFDGQVYFPEGIDGNYTFVFPDVRLNEGENLLKVTAETVYGSVSDQVFVSYKNPDVPEEPGNEEHHDPPVIEVFSPKPEGYLTSETVTVSGTVTGTTNIASVLINGSSATISGSGSQVSFHHDLEFAGSAQLDIEITATDSEGLSKTLSLKVYHDNGAPAISLDNALQGSPVLNTLSSTPLHLSGTVSDTNLGGFTINDKEATLLPIGQDSYGFAADINLVRGMEATLVLKAWDRAGNNISESYRILLDANLDINIISPLENAEIFTEDDTVELDIALTLPGIAVSDGVTVTVDGRTISGLQRNGSTVSGIVSESLSDGEHKLGVKVTAQDGILLADATRAFKVVDMRLVPLALVRQDPANGEQNTENNTFIGFYFNKSIDPSLLSVLVRETYHGEGYGDTPSGADLTNMSRVDMVEIHRDLEAVPGSLSHFPTNSMVAFYPERNFAFGAKIYVTLAYNGEELANTSFAVRPLPTFIQGFIADQFNEPIEGLTVAIADLNLSAVTDEEGSYSFGFGDSGGVVLPPGRFLAVANPAMADSRFGSMEFYVKVESGRLNETGVNNVAIINPQEPFRPIGSGMSQVLLAGGELTLDLSNAELSFPDGRDGGDIHAQFMTVDEQPYGFITGAAPQWVFHVNPPDVEVSGDIGVSMKLPSMMGTYEYIEYIGERVVLVGLDPHSLQIVPVGVGKVDVAGRSVENEGPTAFQRLDIIGFSLVDQEKQPLLESYSKNEMDLNELINRLNQ